MPRRELDLQKKIVALIKRRGGMARILTQSPYTVVGDPDIYGCYNGRMLQLEVKEDDEQPTAIQHVRLAEWKKAGAISTCVRSLAEVEKILTYLEAFG